MQQFQGIWLPAGDTHMREQIALSKPVAGHPTYQYGKLQAAMEYVKERALAVDVGAHVGLWTWQLARLFGQVAAFEPMPVHFECLRRNMQGVGNVALHELALGTHAGSVFMAAAKVNSGESWVLPEAKTGVRVALCKLDDFRLEGVGLLKVDCEGYEYYALTGAVETIQRCRPVVIVEQHEASAVRYTIPHLAGRDLLERLGYVDVKQLTVDHIMVPKELL